MNKILLYLTLTLSLPFYLSLGAISCLPEQQPNLTISLDRADEISLAFSLGEFRINERAEVVLNSFWQDKLVQREPFPVLVVHLAVSNLGTYSLQTSQAVTTNLVYGKHPEPIKSYDTVVMCQPYIYRDIRGVDIYISPFSLQGDSLSVCSNLTITLSRSDSEDLNPLLHSGRKLNPWFLDDYKQHFLNFSYRYEDIAETGSMAIICYDGFQDLMQPYVNWKRQKGIPTTLYPVSQIGSTCDDIKSFLQDLYASDPTLTFVQLVGDIAQVPALVTGSGNQYGAYDPYYTLLEGDDFYPDIFVGRFSAENAAELETQITRTLEYEQGLHAGSWLAKASGVCAVNPPVPGDDNEYNWEHLRLIRNKLLDYTYTEVDTVFANWGADTQDLANSINSGKSLVIYCGEGYETWWITPEFHNDDVYELTNDNMLPFFQVSSCMTGQFGDFTCLAEAFMRARNPDTDEPIGAIGIYAAAPHQGVSPPMRSQDHFVDLLVGGSKNTIGGLCYNGSCNMLDVYGVYGGEYNFLGWNLFGDASLQLRTKLPDSLDINASAIMLPNTTSLFLQTGRPDVQVCLSLHNNIIAGGFTDADGNISLVWTTPSVTGDSYRLTCTGYNLLPYQQDILCYQAGEAFLSISEPVLDDNEDGIINSNELIEAVFQVVNPSQVTASGVWLELVSEDTLLTLIHPVDQIGNVNPGQVKEAQLSFRISKNCPDYRMVKYDLLVHYGSQIRSFPFSILVHSPVPQILSASITPLSNWLNPGDEANMVYEIRNNGSAALKHTDFLLTSEQPWVQILQPEVNIISISPNSVYTLSIPFKLKAEAEPNTTFHLQLLCHPDNASDFSHLENHLVIPDWSVMESFETNLNEIFLWEFPAGPQWTITEGAVDGRHCLKSSALAQNQSSSVEISFRLVTSNPLSKLVFYVKTGPSAENHLHFYINGVENDVWSAVTAWQKAEYILSGGLYTLKWTYEQNSDPASGVGFACLDAICFPDFSIFTNAVLEAENGTIDITIHPYQVIHTPVILKSRNGLPIRYQAVIQKDRTTAPKSENAWLTLNRNTFTPGSVDTYLLKVYNTFTDKLVTKVEIDLRETATALSATDLSQTGEQSLTCTSSFPSDSYIRWSHYQGSVADSLRSVIRLASNLYTDSVLLFYEITLQDSTGFTTVAGNLISLTPNDDPEYFLSTYLADGSLMETESDRLTLSCFEEAGLLNDLSGYRLVIYYNELNYLSLPINITYDPTPGFDTGKITLKAYPNPFTDKLKLAYYQPYYLQEWSWARFSVYNIKGQRVAELAYDKIYPGENILEWNGLDKRGNRLPSGVYIIRMRASDGTEKNTRCLLLN